MELNVHFSTVLHCVVTYFTVNTLQLCSKSNPHTGLDSPIGLQEAKHPIVSRQSAHEGDETVSPMHLAVFNP